MPEEEYLIPLGKADMKREGTRHLAHRPRPRRRSPRSKAAELLAAEHDINAEVIDLRTIRPLDEEAILAQRPQDAPRRLRRGKQTLLRRRRPDLLAMLMEKAFDDLDAPVLRVTSLDAPAIYSPPIEKRQLPTVDGIIEKVLQVCE